MAQRWGLPPPPGGAPPGHPLGHPLPPIPQEPTPPWGGQAADPADRDGADPEDLLYGQPGVPPWGFPGPVGGPPYPPPMLSYPGMESGYPPLHPGAASSAFGGNGFGYPLAPGQPGWGPPPEPSLHPDRYNYPWRSAMTPDKAAEILAARDAFARWQSAHDGVLAAAAGAEFNSVEVVEAAAEGLLSSVVAAAAKELVGFCDSFAEVIFEGEFKTPPQTPGGGGGSGGGVLPPR